MSYSVIPNRFIIVIIKNAFKLLDNPLIIINAFNFLNYITLIFLFRELDFILIEYPAKYLF